MNRVDVLLNDGTTVTWTAEKDQLHHVEVLPAGALAIYTTDGAPHGFRLRHVYGFGLYLTVDIDDPAWA